MKVTFRHVVGWTLPAVLIAGSASAAVIDSFQCRVQVFGPADKLVLNSVPMIQTARQVEIPIPAGPAVIDSQTQYTASSYSFDAELPQLGINMTYNLTYQHALEGQAEGRSRAAQFVCTQGTLTVGHDSANSACVTPSPAPFGPDSNWNQVGVAHGIPAFQPMALTPYELALTTSSGTYRSVVVCNYLGTQE